MRMKHMPMLRAVAAGVCLTVLPVLGDAIEVALARKLNVYGSMPLGTYLHDATMNAVVKADLAADEAWERLATPGAVASRRQQLRAALLAGVGGLPARTPLNARTLETVARDGYVIEKMLFESRPQHYVTALLFLPSGAAFKAPYPGVLVSCGHNLEGKGAPGNQRVCVVLAKNGFAALIYDPFDQGEREQLPKANMMSVSGHVNAGLRAHLLG